MEDEPTAAMFSVVFVCTSFDDSNNTDWLFPLFQEYVYTKQKEKKILGIDITVDFEEVKRAPTECKEKCFQMSRLHYFHYSKAPQC